LTFELRTRGGSPAPRRVPVPSLATHFSRDGPRMDVIVEWRQGRRQPGSWFRTQRDSVPARLLPLVIANCDTDRACFTCPSMSAVLSLHRPPGPNVGRAVLSLHSALSRPLHGGGDAHHLVARIFGSVQVLRTLTVGATRLHSVRSLTSENGRDHVDKPSESLEVFVLGRSASVLFAKATRFAERR
jgi:hypothetical protein